MKLVKIPIPVAFGIGGESLLQVTTARGGRYYEIPFVDGSPRVSSVTTIVSSTLRNIGVERWKESHIKSGLARLEGEELTGDGIASVMSASQNELERAGSLGTSMHEMIESLLAGHETNVPEQLEPVADAFMNWYSSNSWSHVASEVAVWNENPAYAGTVDCIFKDPESNQFIIVDLKSSSAIYSSAMIQVAAYAHAMEGMLVHATEQNIAGNGTGKSHEVQGMIMRFVNEYPLGADGRKLRDQPKQFTGEIEMAMVNTPHWYRAFEAASWLKEIQAEKFHTWKHKRVV